MGSYQHVLAEVSLQVSVHRRYGDGRACAGAERMRRPRGIVASGGHPAGGEGKKIGGATPRNRQAATVFWAGAGELPAYSRERARPSVLALLPSGASACTTPRAVPPRRPPRPTPLQH